MTGLKFKTRDTNDTVIVLTHDVTESISRGHDPSNRAGPLSGIN